MSRLSTLLTLVAAVAVSGSGIVQAADLTVLNAGFEDPVFDDGVFSSDGGPNWDDGYYDVTDPTVWIPDGGDAGLWNPNAADGFSGGAAFAGHGQRQHHRPSFWLRGGSPSV